MIKIASHPRDKALIALLYDSGGRIGELGELRIRNIIFDQHGAIIEVKGKTGARRPRIMFSMSYLATWIDNHPGKEDRDDYLFINLTGKNKGKQMSHGGIYCVVTGIAREAGIKKRVYSHLFRHSRATELANHLTEHQMDAHLGWVPGSNMPSIYVHLSNRDIDNAILKMYGKVAKEETLPELVTKECPRCKKENGSTSQFCTRCGQSLDIKIALNLQEKKNKLPELLALIMSSEEGRQLYFELQNEMIEK